MENADTLSELLNTPPQTLESLLSVVNAEIYASLKESVALQRWTNGERLTDAQLENAMQLIILYEHQHLPAEQRTGQPLNESCSTSDAAARPLKFREQQGSESQ